MNYFILLFILIFSNLSFAATVSVNLPNLNLEQTKVNLTNSTPIEYYNPCNSFNSPIVCVNDSFNNEITITYPLSVDVTGLSSSETVQFTITHNPIITKEFNNFVIKDGSSQAIFPYTFSSSNNTKTYSVEIKISYIGLESLPSNEEFLSIDAVLQ